MFFISGLREYLLGEYDVFKQMLVRNELFFMLYLDKY